MGRASFYKDCKYGLTNALGLAPASHAFSIPMYQGTYDVTLYELRSHRKVAQATLIGSDDECPTSVYRGPRTGTQKLYIQVSASQYVEVFGRYVEK
jgi:hypothetical protein